MQLNELLSLFDQGKKRCHLIGNETAGILAGLDLEGRLFAVLDGEILNRVNPDAVTGHSTCERYLNPGGDGLWPAPEGTAYGYEYAAGTWRVPPGLTGARYCVVEKTDTSATIRAEIDLVNNRRLGIPTVFERNISVAYDKSCLTVKVAEKIKYIGREKLSRDECLLAPWTLCQFDCNSGCEVVFPDVDKSAIWDLYDPSDSQRYQENNLWHTKTDGSQRYQIGLDKQVEWIEFRDPGRGLYVRRTAEPLSPEQEYIDIADAPPSELPSKKGVRYSVYSDTANFMEIEAAGGCPLEIAPDSVMGVTVTTRYDKR